MKNRKLIILNQGTHFTGVCKLTFNVTEDGGCLSFMSTHGSESRSGRLADKPLDITRRVLVSVLFFGLSGLPILGEFVADSKILNQFCN